jgi:hypothetical protein
MPVVGIVACVMTSKPPWIGRVGDGNGLKYRTAFGPVGIVAPAPVMKRLNSTA